MILRARAFAVSERPVSRIVYKRRFFNAILTVEIDPSRWAPDWLVARHHELTANKYHRA